MKIQTLPTTAVTVSGPWMGAPGFPVKSYEVEWEPSEWADGEDEGAVREEWFDTLDEAMARARELLEYRLRLPVGGSQGGQGSR